jgi:hypothetical protein
LISRGIQDQLLSEHMCEVWGKNEICVTMPNGYAVAAKNRSPLDGISLGLWDRRCRAGVHVAKDDND